MANTYFQFKQFTVHQQHCAMKVCTDACLFGSWVAHLKEASTWQSVLDIGTGTGLLSLMIAQSCSANITAIEIDESACGQAKENFAASPWHNKLNAIHGDVRSFKPGQKFDLIISNPPFFEDDLRSADTRKNLALHSTGLSASDLLTKAAQLLAPEGQLALLLPYHREAEFTLNAYANGLYLQRACHVRQTEKHPFFRSMVCFSHQENGPEKEEITIKEHGHYSSTFTNLLQEFYLHL